MHPTQHCSLAPPNTLSAAATLQGPKDQVWYNINPVVPSDHLIMRADSEEEGRAMMASIVDAIEAVANGNGNGNGSSSTNRLSSSPGRGESQLSPPSFAARRDSTAVISKA